MNEKIVMVSNDYDSIDGRSAYESDIKPLTLGVPIKVAYSDFETLMDQLFFNDA